MNACVDNAAFGLAGARSCSAGDFPTVEYKWIFWMSVATAAAFIALAVPRALCLTRYPSIARAPAVLLAAKLFASTALAGLRLGILVVAIRQTSHRTPRRVASTALDFAASCLLLALSPLEHFKSPRPSILTCSYLFLTLIYDVMRCAFPWDVEGDHAAFAGLFTAATVVELIFLVLESTRRRRWVAWEAADHSPEETSSVLSLGLYSWLNALLWRGYHEPLAMQHLYPLDRAISVETLDTRSTSSSPGASTWQLVVWLAKPLGRAALAPVVPRLCLLGLTFSQPFFLQRLLAFLAARPSASPSTAAGLVAAAALIYAGIAVSTALYWYHQERLQSLLRAFLLAALYRKTAALAHAGPAAATLLGADVERVHAGLRLLHEPCASAVQLALAAWLLRRQLGLAFLAPLAAVLLCFAGSLVLSRRAVRCQAAWMARVQRRVAVTAAVLARVADLRVAGLAPAAQRLVQRERVEEIGEGERARVIVAVSAALSQLPQAVAPALAFAFGPRALDQTRAFTALAFLALLTAPLMVVLQSIPIIAACVACLRRIKVFLDQEGRAGGPAIDGSEEAGKEKAFVVVRDGSFGWTAENAVLKNVNLCLPRSSITFVVGPVASGKSTLCRALLGEVPHVQGSVVLGSGKLGYCDQVPFLFNASIRENIIGFSSFDTVRYADVIQATMLSEDLRNLSAGDGTIVGTKGIALSGGQRQRVSLARALYHDAEILVLDDVFSGLDGSTHDLVFQSVFGRQGLLRARGTTAVVCTHSTKFLSTADQIITLSSDGTAMIHGGSAESVQGEHCAQDVITKLETPGAEASRTETTANRPQMDIPSTKAQPVPEPSPTVDTGVYRYWLSTIGPLPLALYLVLVIGIGFCSNFPTIWLKLWSADSVSTAPEHSFGFWIGIYALLGAGVLLCVFPAGLIMLRTAVRLAGTDFHHAAINTVMNSSLRFLGSTDVGKVLNLFSQDMNIMDTQLPRMLNNMSICLAIAIGQAVVIAASSAWLALSYPFFIALLWAVQRVYLPSSKRLRILDLEAKTPLYTNFLDTLSGLPTIRAFGWFPHQLARNNALIDDSQRPSYLLAMAQQWLTLTMNVLVAIVAVILVALATQLGSDAGNVGAGLVTLITLGSTLTTIIIAYTGLETSLGAISRLKTFGEETEQEGRNSDDVVPDEAWPTQGRIQIQNVSASYNGTDRVLKDLTLTIEPGEKLAICGRTGSGKSTILALLLRLLNPLPATSPSPSILIDALPLHTTARPSLRARLPSTPQSPALLPAPASVRTNLDPCHAASPAACAAALARVGLAPLAADLDSPVPPLSAGEAQLFGLARAVLRRREKARRTGVDAGVVLLDEVAGNADAVVGERVGEVVRGEFGAWTVVCVTQRREVAVGCGRVVVVEGGRVVEDGVPGDLVGREGSVFAGLWGGREGGLDGGAAGGAGRCADAIGRG
ncbi:abc transporter [Neofusicoccum parvum]|uniref:Abc transporter n=1 Tax=Neofusicoccum parvum TaxID=310453 RepID=A0ACB5SN41_9PEZI|nr:abc transporter [Neofusicoccum parvum]